MPVGCASHTIQINDRDGGVILGGSTGTLISVDYTRVLDDASTAVVVIGMSGPDCCDQLGNIRTWRHQLWIQRDGQFMWSGYITEINWSYDRVTVTATDIIGLLDRRVPHQDFVFTDTD